MARHLTALWEGLLAEPERELRALPLTAGMHTRTHREGDWRGPASCR